MAPDQVGPDEDTGVTALSNCGATMNTTVFVTVPASPFPVRVSYQRENDNYNFFTQMNGSFVLK